MDLSSARHLAFREGGVIRMQMRDEDVSGLKTKIRRFACVEQDARSNQDARMPSVSRR
jgi:hypothetical protein